MGQPASVQALIERGQKAGIDAEFMRNVASRAEKAGLGAEQTAELLRPAVTLAEQDLPTGPLLNKALEGLAKRVPPSRMTPVLQQLQTHTEQAGGLVSTWLGRADVQRFVDGAEKGPSAERSRIITNVTEAQQQDVPLKNVKQFLDGLPGAVTRSSVSLSQVATAVSVLPDLPGSQSNPAVTNQLLTAALDAGYDAEALRQLPAALESTQRTTQQPALAIARGTARAIAQGTPATSVLQSLFQGSMPGGGPPAGVESGAPGAVPGQGKPPGRGGKPPGAEPPGGGQGPPDDPGGGPPDDPGGDPPGGGG